MKCKYTSKKNEMQDNETVLTLINIKWLKYHKDRFLIYKFNVLNYCGPKQKNVPS